MCFSTKKTAIFLISPQKHMLWVLIRSASTHLNEAFLMSTQNIYFLGEIKYSQLSLSRPRLSRITAYLEVKIWSLFKHENLTIGNKILWKRGEIAPPQKSSYIYICEMWLFNLFFLNSANLICRGMDISKYFRQSLGIRDNESRLYQWFLVEKAHYHEL